ncbi:MAG: LamG domain-containing protein [Sedimentisphaerales bacterium]|nr:LamG domain-containing protein [Sedimentisphaerales bacterium]
MDLAPAPFGDGVVDRADLEVLMAYWHQEFQDPALIAHWKLDETEGVDALDSAGDHHGIVIGAPTWQPDAGKVGGVLEFDGATCVLTDSVLNPNAGMFSVLAWIKGGAPGQVFVSQVDGADWLLADPATGTLMTDLKELTTRRPMALHSSALIADGDWHRVGLVWDGTNRMLYVDGVAVAADTQSDLPDCDGGLHLGCGKDAVPGTFFTGLIDDVRIYTRAVTP